MFAMKFNYTIMKCASECKYYIEQTLFRFQRPRLVAAAKGLTDFDIVDIKLRDDLPEWFPSINPFRKVPAIEFPDGEAIYESIIISGM
jgi:glutathione S-transferase